jgi:hypothetical protein
LNLHASFIVKDEVTHNPTFENDIEVMGQELYDKTGIAVKLLMIKKLPKGKSIAEYEKEIISNFNEPTILLTFSELDQKVDIIAKPHELYQLFDKKQILSPVASWLQSFFLAVFFSNSWDEFKETSSNYGGTIIPILAQKAKEPQKISKYSAALFNGYADIVDQVAKSKGVELEHAVSDTNKTALLFVKLFFYGFILYAIFLYIKRKLAYKGQKEK